jgi:hypothetical protein
MQSALICDATVFRNSPIRTIVRIDFQNIGDRAKGCLAAGGRADGILHLTDRAAIKKRHNVFDRARPCVLALTKPFKKQTKEERWPRS